MALTGPSAAVVCTVLHFMRPVFQCGHASSTAAHNAICRIDRVRSILTYPAQLLFLLCKLVQITCNKWNSMSFLSRLQNIFTPPSTGDPDLDDTRPGFEWNQNVRIVLAMIIVIISAFVVFWILS